MIIDCSGSSSGSGGVVVLLVVVVFDCSVSGGIK